MVVFFGFVGDVGEYLEIFFFKVDVLGLVLGFWELDVFFI